MHRKPGIFFEAAGVLLLALSLSPRVGLSREAILIPAGEFHVGSLPGEGDRDETPQWDTTLPDFYIDREEVTNQEYADFLTILGDTLDHESLHGTWIHYSGDPGSMTFWVEPGYENHPIVGPTAIGAYSFALSIGGRLPTEFEWEKAARGTDARTYPWGETVSENIANFFGSNDPFEDFDHSLPCTTPVGFYDGTIHDGYATQNGASPYGVHDMAGNAAEWTASFYSPYGDTLAPNYITVRGGSWLLGEREIRTPFRAYRLYLPTAEIIAADNGIGFRCAYDEDPNGKRIVPLTQNAAWALVDSAARLFPVRASLDSHRRIPWISSLRRAESRDPDAILEAIMNLDQDMDGLPAIDDPDDDNDGIADEVDSDMDGDGVSNEMEDIFDQMLDRPPFSKYDWRDAGIEPFAVHTAQTNTLEDVEKTLALMRKIGIQWVRSRFSYATEGFLDSYGWYVDKLTDSAYRHNMRLLSGVGGKAQDSEQTLEDPGPILRGLAEIVDRAKDRIKYWEIWNEQNCDSNWVGTQAEYAQFLQACYDTAKAVDPSCEVMMGGFAGNGIDEGGCPEHGPANALSTYYQVGAGDAFDRVNIHLYIHPFAPNHGMPKFLEKVQATYDTMAAYGDSAKMIWITETGYPRDCTNPPVNAEEQAEWLTEVYETIPYLPYVERVFWMNFRDFVPNDDLPCSGNHGLLMINWDPWPAYQAYGDLDKGMPTASVQDGISSMVKGAIGELSARPNPASSVTTIRFALSQGGPVRIDLYDVAGRRVRQLFDGTLAASTHRLEWDGTDDAGNRVASGVYYYRIDTGAEQKSLPLIRFR